MHVKYLFVKTKELQHLFFTGNLQAASFQVLLRLNV